MQRLIAVAPAIFTEVKMATFKSRASTSINKQPRQNPHEGDHASRRRRVAVAPSTSTTSQTI